MNQHDKQRPDVREARASLLRDKPNPKLPSTEVATPEEKNVAPDPPGSSVVQAAPPLMLRLRIALRRLCRGTGCEISIQTLYLWIAMGKIDSVRVGGRIFIPAQTVDNLIETCLQGDRI